MKCHLMLALPILQLLILHHIYPYTVAAAAAAASSTSKVISTRYIRRSCGLTLYPRLCYKSLAIYAGKIKSSPEVLAQTSLNVTLSVSKATSKIINRCSRVPGMKPIEVAATVDCVEEVSDALDELRMSIKELGHAVKGSRRFLFQMSDVQTWVSAALTDEGTCLDGFDEPQLYGRVETVVRREITKIAHHTSIALALINNYASN